MYEVKAELGSPAIPATPPFLATKSRGQTRANRLNMEGPRKPLTYRLENIPNGTTVESLAGSFHVEDRPFVRIRSLVPAVDDHDLSGDLTATFEHLPGGASREPRLLDSKITMGKDFHGLTPLYQPKGPIAAE